MSLGLMGRVQAQSTDLYVGSNSSGQTTNFTSGTNAYSNTYVGYATNASNNLLTIGNRNTLLTNSADVFIGRSGVSNSMVISNGGRVVDSNGFIGFDTNSSNNSVLVTGVNSGSNSLWSNRESVFVGYYGSGNSLVISNGGRVVDNYGHVGLYPTSSNNSVLVTGSNSLWSNSEILYVGYYGSSNSLVISNGGRVVDNYGTVGFDTTSSNNSVLVTGSNSLWTNREAVIVGEGGSSNSLVISNGGRVVDINGFIGITTASSNNSVLVTGSNSLWSNSGTLFVGSGGSGNSLVISNGGRVVDNYGAIGDTTSSNNSVLVTGSNSLWSNSVKFYVGYRGSSNSLVISEGGTVMNNYGTIGNQTTSSNNSVLVTGSNSLWSNSGYLVVGEGGSGTLTVANGGIVRAQSMVIASNSGSIGTLNIGTLGGSDTAGTIITPTIGFGLGTGTINFNQIDTATLTSSISGFGTIQQLGSGTTILTGSNTYSGLTLVQAGTLLANNTAGSAVGTSTVLVTDAGTLGGTGSIGGATTIESGGSLTPGTNGVGSLSFTNSLTLLSGSTTTFQITSTNNFTSINLIGSTLTYGGSLVFNIASYTPADGDAFTLFNRTGEATENGDFSSVSAGSLQFTNDAAGTWSATNGSYLYQFKDSTRQLTVYHTVHQAVPEPSTYALLGLGALALIVVCFRKVAASIL